MKKNPGRKERRKIAKQANSKRSEVKAIDKKHNFYKNWKKYKTKKKLAKKMRKENRCA